MNREIKFRAWTGVIMEYNVMVGFLGAFYVEGLNTTDSACLSPMNTIYPKTVPIMQYTGMKDRNGKEIYEGDICEGHSDGLGKIVWNPYDGGYNYEFYDGNIVGIWEVKDELFVIGNVYENSRLFVI